MSIAFCLPGEHTNLAANTETRLSLFDNSSTLQRPLSYFERQSLEVQELVPVGTAYIIGTTIITFSLGLQLAWFAWCWYNLWMDVGCCFDNYVIDHMHAALSINTPPYSTQQAISIYPETILVHKRLLHYPSRLHWQSQKNVPFTHIVGSHTTQSKICSNQPSFIQRLI